MPVYEVIIKTHDAYEKHIVAPSATAARRLIEAEDTWGSPDAGWKRTDDCYSGIERIEEVEEA